jgi:hypothetical protein
MKAKLNKTSAITAIVMMIIGITLNIDAESIEIPVDQNNPYSVIGVDRTNDRIGSSGISIENKRLSRNFNLKIADQIDDNRIRTETNKGSVDIVQQV